MDEKSKIVLNDINNSTIKVYSSIKELDKDYLIDGLGGKRLGVNGVDITDLYNTYRISVFRMTFGDELLRMLQMFGLKIVRE